MESNLRIRLSCHCSLSVCTFLLLTLFHSMEERRLNLMRWRFFHLRERETIPSPFVFVFSLQEYAVIQHCCIQHKKWARGEGRGNILNNCKVFEMLFPSWKFLQIVIWSLSPFPSINCTWKSGWKVVYSLQSHSIFWSLFEPFSWLLSWNYFPFSLSLFVSFKLFRSME